MGYLAQFGTLFYILIRIGTHGKYIEGSLLTKETWQFVTRFCFLSDKGKLEFEFVYPKSFEPQNVLLYYDEPDQWPAVYKTNKTCWQKLATLRPENQQVIYLSLHHFWSGCELKDAASENPYYRCHGSRVFKSARERWWFVAASNCMSVKTCTQKESPPHIKPENQQKIILDTKHFWSGCLASPANSSEPGLLRCRASRTFKSARERWWFVALSRCVNDSQGLSLQYKIWLTNGHETFFKHFSADEFYILQVDIAFLIVQLIMLISAGVVAVQLKERQLFHSTYKMYIVSLSFEVGHLLFSVVGYGNYAQNGLADTLYGFKTFARILESVSLLTFLLMLILMGKGFTITRGRISTSGSIKIAIFMTLYVICYAVLFIYEANFFDPGEVLYLYESPAGYGLIALRLIAWVWFCYAVFFTLKHYPEKSSFYFPFLAFYTVWFWLQILIIFVANFAMAKHMRETLVNGIHVGIAFLGNVYFLILTRPSVANKNFPYHVRTSQIGIMETHAHNGAPRSSAKDSDSFSPHPYAPSSDMSVTNGAPNFTELFTVANARSAPLPPIPTGNNRNSQEPIYETPDLYPSKQPNGNLEKFPHHDTTHNPFIVTK